MGPKLGPGLKYRFEGLEVEVGVEIFLPRRCKPCEASMSSSHTRTDPTPGSGSSRTAEVELTVRAQEGKHRENHKNPRIHDNFSVVLNGTWEALGGCKVLAQVWEQFADMLFEISQIYRNA